MHAQFCSFRGVRRAVLDDSVAVKNRVEHGLLNSMYGRHAGFEVSRVALKNALPEHGSQQIKGM